jgi:cell division protein ZapA
VTVTILGKEFMVACPEDERAALVAAASYLDKKMREIRTSGKVIGTERTAHGRAQHRANSRLAQPRHGY